MPYMSDQEEELIEEIRKQEKDLDNLKSELRKICKHIDRERVPGTAGCFIYTCKACGIILK